MIPLVKQVTSFELSKQLESLGVKQDGQWYWEKRTFLLKAPDWLKNSNDICLVDCDYEKKENWKHYSFEYYSAFTVAELGEILPYDIHSYKSGGVDKWCCCDNHGMLISRKTEVDTRAKMLIYLMKNKLMETNE